MDVELWPPSVVVEAGRLALEMSSGDTAGLDYGIMMILLIGKSPSHKNMPLLIMLQTGTNIPG